MKLPPIFQDAILVYGIMCLENCGNTVEKSLRDSILKYYPDVQIYISAEPKALGIQQIIVEICGEGLTLSADEKNTLSQNLRAAVSDVGFGICEDGNSRRASSSINWVNILINVIAIASIIALSIVFPPSLLLSLGLGAICFSATLFTARDYIFNFIKSLSNFNFKSMQVTISIGWLLSLVHSAYHIGVMPLMRSFAMTFMNFIMPLVLVTIVNVMDEIKRQISLRSQRLTLNGLNSIFPQMRKQYMAARLTEDEVSHLKSISKINYNEEYFKFVNTKSFITTSRSELSPGMLIEVKAGECFPVDGHIVSGVTVVDKSIITGEQPISTELNMFVESGCVNMWRDVKILATTNSYHSTVNKILFTANTIDKDKSQAEVDLKKLSQQRFYYFYFAIFAIGFLIALALSIALGYFTFAGMLQTMVGILFAICPCTIAIGYYLPNLLQTYQIGTEGVIVNNINSYCAVDDFEVFVFDKTGTLTANSVVHAVDESIPKDLFAKIYQAESSFGRAHPIANALQNYFKQDSALNEEEEVVPVEIATSGITVDFAGETLCIGNSEYLRSKGVHNIPEDLDSGFTPVYVSFCGVYQGKILIGHNLRPGMQESLQTLKKMGKTLIMLTGDKEHAAKSLNKQFNPPIFLNDNIHFGQDPNKKVKTIEEIIQNKGAAKVCFIGDGLNDALCSRRLRSLGGTSMSITADEKAAFFTDVSLNGGLDYLFVKKDLANFEAKIVRQNRWILACGAVIFLTFLISFPVLGIGMSPLIPMLVMFATTIFTLVNSYRTRISAANALKKTEPSFLSKIMRSEFAAGLLIGGSLMLVVAVLVASIASLQLTLPLFVFGGGAATIASSSFLVAATVMLGGFVGVTCAYGVQSRLESGVVVREKDNQYSLGMQP